MAVEPHNTAKLVATRDLPKMIEAAAKVAHDRLGITDPHKVVVRWDLAGYVIRDAGKAHDLAESIVGELGKHGVDAVPAVLTIGGGTIAGFYERATVPQIREL